MKATFKNCGAIDIKKENEFIIAPYSVYQGCHPTHYYDKDLKQYTTEDLSPHKCGGTNNNCLFKGKQYIPHFKSKPDTREMTNDELANLEDYFKEVPDWITSEFEEEIQINTSSTNSEDENIQVRKYAKKEKILNLIDCCKNMFLKEMKEWISIVWTVKSVFTQLFPTEVEQARELVHKYSNPHHKYTYAETDKLFNEGKISSYSVPTLLKMAKQSDPERYSSIIHPIPIKLDFTPDKTINECHVPLSTYVDSRTEVIALQSNMKTGKTYCIPDYINHLNTVKNKRRIEKQYKTEDLKVLIVLFRVSLVDSIYNDENWSKLNFTHYKSLTNKKVISSKDHPRLIVQFDSLHKVIGKYDLLILDEIESTTSHFSNGFVKAFQSCYNKFIDYCEKVPKVIALDATLQNSTLSTLFPNRSITKIKNIYKSFSDYSAYFTHESTFFEHQLIEELKAGKKIVLPTNVEAFAIKIAEMCKDITTTSDGKPISIGIKTADLGTDIQTNDWNKYDLFIYSPTIVAGVSFNLEHFNMCFAYFTNKTSDAEFCIQQLARVRNLNDKIFYIYTPHSYSEVCKPIEDQDLDDYILELIHTGSTNLNLDGLTVSAYDESVKKDTFYLLFRKMLKKKHLTSINVHGYIEHILKEHGIKCNKWLPYLEDENIVEKLKEVKMNSDSISKRLKIEEIESICNATPIDSFKYESLIKVNSTQLSKSDQKSITRYLYTDTYGLPFDAELKVEEVKDKIKRMQGVRNFKLINDKSLEESIQFVKNKHTSKQTKKFDTEVVEEVSTDEEIEKEENKLNNTLQRKDEIIAIKHLKNKEKREKLKLQQASKVIKNQIRLNKGLTLEYDSEEEVNSEDEILEEMEIRMSRRKILKKIDELKEEKRKQKIIKAISTYNSKTTKDKIIYDKKWIKMKYCLEFIKEAGFTSFESKQRIELNWINLRNYIIKHNKSIQSLFELHNCNLSEDDDIEDKNIKNAISKYVNAKLESMLGLKIEKYANSTEYKLKKLA